MVYWLSYVVLVMLLYGDGADLVVCMSLALFLFIFLMPLICLLDLIVSLFK